MSEASNSQKSDPLRIIGRRDRRVDSHDKITGRAQYTDDMRLPGMLYGRLKRSPVAHGSIDSISIDKALALDGVEAVITGKDLPVRFGILPVTQDETAMGIDRVRYVGEPVAAVCARTEAIAQEAIELIEVSYTPFETILSVEDAFGTDTRIHEHPKFEGNAHRVIALEFGDVDAALADSDHVRDDCFYVAGNTHVPMETHSTIADYDGTRLDVIVSHQAPYYIQKILPKILEIPPQTLRVRVPYVGGGFGGKLDVFPDTIAAAKFSMITGKPVKITLSREEVFYNHRGRHPSLMWIKSGIKGERIHSIHFKAFLDGGAYGSFGTAAAYYHGALQGVTYKIPNYKAEIVRFYTNKPPCGPKRGHGTPQPRFALECHLDRVAEDLEMNPIALRKGSLIEPHSITVNHLRVGSCGLEECIDRVQAASGFDEKHRQLPHGHGIGFAIGSYLSGAALPIYWNEMPHSSVLVKADRSGGITVYSGHTEIGQGSDTVLAFIVAECLGVDPDDIGLVLRDTDSTPPDLGSYSSRVTMMMGNAAHEAATKLRDAIAGAAAEALETSPDDLRFEDRQVVNRSNPERRMTLEEAIVCAEEKVGALSFAGNYRPDVKYGDFKGAGVGPSPAYSYTACAVELTVDPDTGIIVPTDVWIAHDIGRCINRKSVEGQVDGGVYMGLGEVMMEEMAFTKDGLLKNAGLLDYKTPTIRETANIHIDLIEDPDPEGPFGAKEVGQGPLLPVIPAFANAVYDAIGVRFDETPITPDKVVQALDRGEKRVGPRRPIDFPFPEPLRVESGHDVKA
jgi:4-hydroxybenzoyl-CoA reductase subunit alpha